MFAKAFMIACTVAVQTAPAVPSNQPVLAVAPAGVTAPAAPTTRPTTAAPQIAAEPARPAPATPSAPVGPVSVADPFTAPKLAIHVPVAPIRVAASPAATVVDKVQDFYNKTRQYQAIFRQTYTNKAFGQKTVKNGRVFIKKPGKMRWEYQGRKGLRSIFVSDGVNAWMVENDNKQYAHQRLNDSVLPVAVTFLFGKGKLTDDFVPSIDNSGRFGKKKDYVLHLIPKTPSAQYKELFLVVDRGNFRVKQSIVVEGNGNVNHFKFYEPNTSKAIADKLFVVNVKVLKSKHYRKINPQKAKGK